MENLNVPIRARWCNSAVASAIVDSPVRRLSALLLLGLCVPAFAQQTLPGTAGSLPGANQPALDYWDLRAQQNEELYIPPTLERPLGEDAGPRIRVNQIVLDIEPRLAALIDPELRSTLNRSLTNHVIENQQEGFTIGRLENVANDVTDILRDGGFILSLAYLPEQSVEDLTINISVLSGSLEQVAVDGNNRYSADRLLDPFNDLMGMPVVKSDVERSILAVRNYPGLSTSAVFSPGDALGGSRLTLRVSEDPFDFALVADNHGTESTGENRLRADLYFNNLFGAADSLTANILQTFDPAENTYGGFLYRVPFFGHENTLSLGYSRNSFEVAQGFAAGVGVGGANLTGETDIVSLGFSRNLRLARRSRVDLAFDVATKDAELLNLGFDSGDKLSVVSLDLSIEAVDDFGSGGINQLQIRYSQGLADFLGSMDENGDGQSTRRGGSGVLAGGDFSKVLARYQRLQRISASNSLLIRVEGQFSSDLLTSLEQVVLGGPNNVRGYPIAQFLVDEAAFTSLEWIVDLNQLFGEGGGNTRVSLSFFGDYSLGVINDPLPVEVDDVDISGWGVGFSIAHTTNSGNQFLLKIEGAEPITDLDFIEEDNSQVFAQLSYTFN